MPSVKDMLLRFSFKAVGHMLHVKNHFWFDLVSGGSAGSNDVPGVPTTDIGNELPSEEVNAPVGIT